MYDVHITMDYGYGGLRLYIIDRDPGSGKIMAFAKPIELEFEATTPGTEAMLREPTLKLDYYRGEELLQAIAKALVGAGFRDKAVSKDGEVKRMEDHLTDLRRLVFEKEITIKELP